MIHGIRDRQELVCAELKTVEAEKVAALVQLRGIGPNNALVLDTEQFCRDVCSRRQLASRAGPAPAAQSTEQRAVEMVPGACQRPQRACAEAEDRDAGAQAADGLWKSWTTSV